MSEILLIPQITFFNHNQLGFNWPMTLAFYLLEYFTEKNCIINMHTNSTNTWQNETIPIQYQFDKNTCSSDIQKEVDIV